MILKDILYLRNYYKQNGRSILSGVGLFSDGKIPGYRRVLEARDNNQKIYSPRKLLSANRLDIAAKTMFARSYINSEPSGWPEEVYREHLRSWNDFYEDMPLKESYDDFRTSFTRVIDSYVGNTMVHVNSPVTVNSLNGDLRNGAHRVAAAIVTNNYVNVLEKRLSKRRFWNADFFRGRLEESIKHPLDDKYIDAMTVEYVSLRPSNLFAVVVFPAAKGHRAEAMSHLASIGKIVNHRSFKGDYFNSKSVIRQLYYGESWNYEGSEGVSNKANWCFSGDGEIEVYIIESSLDLEARIAEKSFLRGIWGVDKNSIHMTDTEEEVNVVVRMFFHENTVETLRRYNSFSEASLERFDSYRSTLPGDYIERDEYCIDSSAIMDFYGLRKAADIDYISLRGSSLPSVNGVDRHTEEYVKYYPLSVGDMISNPSNYFYYAGCKMLMLDLVRLMKANRSKLDSESRSKDLKDITLIEKSQIKPGL